MSDSLRALLDSSPLGAGNAPYVESLYEQFLADPSSVESETCANSAPIVPQ